MGIGLYRAIVPAEGHVKSAIEPGDHTAHGRAVVVGHQAEFEIASAKRVYECHRARANRGVLCGFPLFCNQNIAGAFALFRRQIVYILDDGLLGRALDFCTQIQPVDIGLGQRAVHVEDDGF